MVGKEWGQKINTYTNVMCQVGTWSIIAAWKRKDKAADLKSIPAKREGTGDQCNPAKTPMADLQVNKPIHWLAVESFSIECCQQDVTGLRFLLVVKPGINECISP